MNLGDLAGVDAPTKQRVEALRARCDLEDVLTLHLDLEPRLEHHASILLAVK